MSTVLFRSWCVVPPLATALITLCDSGSAQVCQQRDYIVDNQVNSSVSAVYYEQRGKQSGNLVALNISPGGKHMITILGSGPANYRVELTNGQAFEKFVAEICAFSQIIIAYRSGVTEMRVR